MTGVFVGMGILRNFDGVLYRGVMLSIVRCMKQTVLLLLLLISYVDNNIKIKAAGRLDCTLRDKNKMTKRYPIQFVL